MRAATSVWVSVDRARICTSVVASCCALLSLQYRFRGMAISERKGQFS
jgi:hypothetical protein